MKKLMCFLLLIAIFNTTYGSQEDRFPLILQDMTVNGGSESIMTRQNADAPQRTPLKKKSFRCPKIIKPLFMVALLFSGNLYEAQALPIPTPYQEANFTGFIYKTYSDDIRPGTLAEYQDHTRTRIKYTVAGGDNRYRAMTATNRRDIGLETNCVIKQSKIERAWQLRKIANEMYNKIPEYNISIAEQYAAISSAVNLEVQSHMLEIEAINMLGADSSSCATPSP